MSYILKLQNFLVCQFITISRLAILSYVNRMVQNEFFITCTCSCWDILCDIGHWSWRLDFCGGILLFWGTWSHNTHSWWHCDLLTQRVELGWSGHVLRDWCSAVHVIMWPTSSVWLLMVPKQSLSIMLPLYGDILIEERISTKHCFCHFQVGCMHPKHTIAVVAKIALLDSGIYFRMLLASSTGQIFHVYTCYLFFYAQAIYGRVTW